MKKIALILITLLTLKNNVYCQWDTIMIFQSFTQDVGVKHISSPKTNIIWACVFDTAYINPTNQFYKTTDNGITWTLGAVPSSLGLMDITSISAINKDTAWAAVNKHGVGSSFTALFSKIMKTTDGGITWNTQSSASYTGPTNHINFIHFKDENNGICVGDSNTGFWESYKTTNGGTNWNRINSTNIPPNMINEKGSDNCYDTHNNIIWFGTTKGRVYKSLDFGSTWNVYNTGLNNISNISMTDSLNGLASNGLSLIKTSDGGATWNVLSYNGTFYKDDLMGDKNNVYTFYSAGWKNGIMGSSYTSDGGLNWISIDNKPHTTINATDFNIWSGGITYEAETTEHFLFFYNWLGDFTNIKKNEKLNNLNFYPNPFSDEINFKIKDNLSNRKVTIEIYNQTGILVNKLDKIDKTDTKFDLNYLSKGLYLFKVFDEQELLMSCKIIKE